MYPKARILKMIGVNSWECPEKEPLRTRSSQKAIQLSDEKQVIEASETKPVVVDKGIATRFMSI